MSELANQITTTVGLYLPSLIAAIAILILGWLVALLIASLVRTVLNRTTFDNRIATWTGIREGVQVERVVSKGVYYLIMIFVLVAFFQTLGLTIVTQPLNSLLNELFTFVPNLLGAAALLVLAWLIATGLKFLVSRVFRAVNLDERLQSQAGLATEQRVPMSETLANVIYWFVFLLFLPAILGALNMQGLLDPVRTMVDELLGYLPNIFGAALIVLIGWFVARIIRQIVTGLLVAVGTDRLGERLGVGNIVGQQSLSSIIGTVVYVLVLIPAIIAGLNALQIEAVSAPAASMLTTLLNALPNIFGAMVILTLTYLIGRLVAGLVTNVLSSVGFDRVLRLIGLGPTAEGQRTASEIAGYLVLVGLMLFATIQAAELLGFEIVAVLVAQFLTFAAQVILGIIIFGLGLYLGNLARSLVLSTAGENAVFLSQVARLAIIILATAMGLRQMGIANDIVNLAFGLLLGAIAVAIALAFGLGARDIAHREVEGWLRELRGGSGGPSSTNPVTTPGRE
ncbi:MAG: mechanosensitive ion channel [Anaerolineae bacterium]|nr:mechanosensitive ion channel [Anaerolineae bacterium]